MTIKGADRVTGNMDRITRAVPVAVEQAIDGETKAILDESRQGVPVKTGRLRKSGRRRIQAARGEVRGAVGYGNRARYAAPVHKRKQFLADAIDEGRFRRRLETALKRVING